MTLLEQAGLLAQRPNLNQAEKNLSQVLGMPADHRHLIYELDECEIDIARRELRIRGATAPVGARAMEILEVLVRSGGTLITKENLIKSVWPGAIVPDNTIQVHISAIRKALGPYRALLRTESGRGYRMVGGWTVRQSNDVAKPVDLDRSQSADALPPTNIPASAFRLIGRTETAEQVRDLLSAYRIVTLTGPGGIGKTSLAMEAARALLPSFKDGSWLVELASLLDVNLVPTAVSTVLNLRLRSDTISAEAVARAIAGSHVLLVLDNCEHVIDAVAGLVETILGICPHVTILATSREVLRVAGEYAYRVPPLEVPPPDPEKLDDVLRHSAAELFIARTQAQNSTIAPDPASLSAIASICRHLDGIPLAIEFAAARAAVLGIAEVAARLGDRFQLLTSGRRTALPRHQTLRAALDWSYHLLPEGEQLLLRHLAMFPAGFTVDAASAVMQDAALDPTAVTEGIANLVAKSLVALAKSDAVSRWFLLDTIRVYALEKLAAHNEFDRAARHQAAYFRDFAGSAQGFSTRFSENDWSRLVCEIDNVRAALDWCFSDGGDNAIGVDLTAAYAPVWLHLSLMDECRERCERALQGLDPNSASHARLQMWLQIALAISLFDMMGSAQQARDLLATALAAAETLRDLHAQAGALSHLVANYIFQAEQGKARAAAERLGQVAARIGDPAIVRIADRLMGTALVMLGRPREAQQFLERFLKAPPFTEDQGRLLWYPADHRAAARAFLARALWLQGFLEKAYSEAQASLDELQATDHQLLVCRVLYFGMCRIAPSTGNFAAAEQSVARLTQAATSLNAPFWQTAGRLLCGKLMIERHEFAEGVEMLRDALDTCRRTGWRMSYPEFNGALAAGLAALGRLDEALAAVNEGLTATDQGDEGQDLYVAEVMRIKGEVLFLRDDTAPAERCFHEALKIARKQDALFWELRVTLSFARMRATQGHAEEARQLLEAVYYRFTEGFEAPDLRAARAVLDELPAS